MSILSQISWLPYTTKGIFMARMRIEASSLHFNSVLSVRRADGLSVAGPRAGSWVGEWLSIISQWHLKDEKTHRNLKTPGLNDHYVEGRNSPVARARRRDH